MYSIWYARRVIILFGLRAEHGEFETDCVVLPPRAITQELGSSSFEGVPQLFSWSKEGGMNYKTSARWPRRAVSTSIVTQPPQPHPRSRPYSMMHNRFRRRRNYHVTVEEQHLKHHSPSAASGNIHVSLLLRRLRRWKSVRQDCGGEVWQDWRDNLKSAAPF